MGTSSDKAAILALLKKYRSGQCTPEEVIRIREWFDSFDEELPDDPAFVKAADEAAANVMHALFSEKKRWNYMPLLRVAAVFTVIVSGLLFSLKYFKRSPVPVTYADINVAKGERKKITLPDGTTVVINALSKLSIPSDFGVKTRSVNVTGECLFDVKADEERPFIINTDSLKTVVLGTSLDVKAYPGEKAIQITVLNGKVRVEKGKEIIAPGITHNQMLTYNKEQDQHTLSIANAAEIADWQANRFYFQQASIAEIAAVLERQYNITITLTGHTKKSCLYTLQLKNETIENALFLLSQLSGITYQVNNQEIKINTASCE